jgi:AmmeMemoRadiSam system protein A
VGYAAIAFFGDDSMNNQDHTNAQFSEDQGGLLVKLARKTIQDKLGCEGVKSGSEDLLSALDHDCFKLHCGTFVTLKIKGQLRGCIGNLTPTETVLEGVKRNAVNAAFHDPRFSPLSRDELDRTEIEVSILTKPRPLAYSDGQDLINKLRVNVDGVIIRKGHASATFLPQVWEQLPVPQDFLSHLCMKAGLPSDAWHGSDLEVLTYQVQYFEEHQ